MIGEKEKQRIQAALDGGWELEIHMRVRGWRVSITTAPASPVWGQKWIARVYGVKPYTTSSQWCRDADEVDWALEAL